MSRLLILIGAGSWLAATAQAGITWLPKQGSAHWKEVHVTRRWSFDSARQYPRRNLAFAGFPVSTRQTADRGFRRSTRPASVVQF